MQHMMDLGLMPHLWYRDTIWVSFLMSWVLRAPCTHSRTTPAQRPPAKPSTSLLTAFRWLSLTSNIRDQYGPASGSLSAVSLPSPCNDGDPQSEGSQACHKIGLSQSHASLTRGGGARRMTALKWERNKHRVGVSEIFDEQPPADASRIVIPGREWAAWCRGKGSSWGRSARRRWCGRRGSRPPGSTAST